MLWFVGFLIRDNQLDLLRHWFLLLAPYGGALRHIAGWDRASMRQIAAREARVPSPVRRPYRPRQG